MASCYLVGFRRLSEGRFEFVPEYNAFVAGEHPIADEAGEVLFVVLGIEPIAGRECHVEVVGCFRYPVDEAGRFSALDAVLIQDEARVHWTPTLRDMEGFAEEFARVAL